MIDVDINDRTKTPCQTPGCDWPSYHVCLLGKPDLFPRLLGQERENGGMSDAHKEALRQGALDRWARQREKNKARDEEIVSLYDTHSIKQLRAKFHIGRWGLMTILTEAAERGEIVLRTAGFKPEGAL